jgi:Putative adhesin
MPSWKIAGPQQLDLTGEVSHLDVFLWAGRLSVVGTDGPARVEVSRTGEATVGVTHEGGRLSVRHDPVRPWPGPFTPLWWWLRGRGRFDADVSVALPDHATADLHLVGGPLVVSGVHGDLELECASGRISLLGTAGRVRATMVSGPIEVLGCGGELALETISGEITLADSTAHRVTAKTISGSLTADLDNPPDDSRIALETVSGELTIRIRDDSDLTVDLAAASGRVTSTFPELSGAGRHSRKVHGRLGLGTGQLTASATSGNITLLRRPVDPEFGEAP